MTTLKKFLARRSKGKPAYDSPGKESEWLDFCEMTFEGKQAWVGDLSFFPSTENATLLPIKPGPYVIQAKIMVYPGDRRISRLRVVEVGAAPEQGKQIGETWTDTAVTGIADWVRTQRAWGTPGSDEANRRREQARDQGACGVLDCDAPKGISIPFVESGFGDGRFPIFGLWCSRLQVGFEIEFIPPDETYPIPTEEEDEDAESEALAESPVTPPAAGYNPIGTDYRVSRKKAGKFKGEKLHWALIAGFWDDYWEAFRKQSDDIAAFAQTNLTPGQRALISVDIFNKQVLEWGFRQVLFLYCCPDLFLSYEKQLTQTFFINEVRNAYKLLNAEAYARLLEEAIKVTAMLSWPISALGKERDTLSRKAEKLDPQKDAKAVQEITALKTELLRKRIHHESVREDAWEKFGKQFKALLKDKDTRIENNMEAYVLAQPQMVFKD